MKPKEIQEYIRDKNQNPPENIIKGVDPVTVSLVKQMYSALKDRGDNLVLYERAWLTEIEKIYKDQKVYNEYFLHGLEDLLKQAYEMLIPKSKSWNVKEEDVLSMAERIIFLKIREDIYKVFFDNVEDALFSALQYDFSKRIELPFIGNNRENIFTYKAVMLNTLLETLENSVVSMHSVNSIIDSLPGLLVIVTDKTGNIRFINKQASDLFGTDNPLKKSFKSVLPEIQIVNKKLERHGNINDEPFSFMAGADKSLPVRGKLTVQRVNSSPAMEEIIYMIQLLTTESKNDKLFLKQQLHDKISPINTIMGGLELLERKLIDKDSRLLLQNLKNTAANLKESTNYELKNILSETYNPEPLEKINIKELIDSICVDLHITDNKDIKLIKDIAAVKFLSRKKMMHSILQNLISNAVKYKKTSSKTVIRITFRKLGRNKFILEVCDTGRGIAAGKLRKIFQPLFRISNQEEGSGIGLSLVKDYVDILNGTIEVKSKPSKGTVFTIIFPSLK